MPERIQQILNRIVEWWKNFSTRQKALIISIAAVVAVAFSILGFVMTRPTMVNLITCDSAKQASSVKDLLDSNSITYEVSDDGLTYTVKQEDRANATILLGSNDIPSDGYSISDAIDGSFSTTEADKNKKYQLYLEEKMADDLETISNVSKAYVTLSLPSDDGTILSKDEEAYASINLQLSDDMSEEQAAGIARYVATALGNKSTENIEIIDGDGNTLFSGGDESSTAGKASSNLTVQQKAEANVTSAVKSVILGTNVYDNVEVGMNLDMNFDQQKVEDYHYYVDRHRAIWTAVPSLLPNRPRVPAVHRVPIPMMMIRPMSWKTVRSLPRRLRTLQRTICRARRSRQRKRQSERSIWTILP